jgi:hypothetical protein
MKIRIVTMMVLLLAPLMANAAIPCNHAGSIVPDGRMSPLTTIDTTADQWMASRVVAGHSYSLEVSAPFGGAPNTTISAAFNTGPCSFSNASDFVDTTNTSPTVLGVNGNFARASYTAPTDRYVYATVHVTGGSSTNYTFSVTDTTLFNPRWSTNQGYITVYGFQNTTNQTIHGTLTVNVTFGGSGSLTYDLNGGAGVAPGAQFLVALGPGLTIDVPAGEGGSAMLAHDGPPGALAVDAYFINSVSLVPAIFAPRNTQH